MVSRIVVIACLSGALGSAGCGQATTKLEAYPESFVGVGMILEINNEWPVVKKVLNGGSASAAGVSAGDRVERIDGLSTEGMGLGDVVAKIRGEAGSQVTLAIRREVQKMIVVVPRQRMSKEGSVVYKAAADR